MATAAALGLWLVGLLLGRHYTPAIVTVALCSVLGAGAWGQCLEASSQLSRPFGYFGGLFGGGRTQAPPPPPQQPMWNAPPPQYQQQGYPPGYGAPPPQYAQPPGYRPGMFSGGGSGFLGSALTTAAGGTGSNWGVVAQGKLGADRGGAGPPGHQGHGLNLKRCRVSRRASLSGSALRVAAM